MSISFGKGVGRGRGEKELGFKKRPMVEWYSPSQLAQTGIRALISSIFGNYADGRELQAALDDAKTPAYADFSNKDTVWIDYVSDMGAGWNSSYSVAYLLGRKHLTCTDSHQQKHQLPRGDILVMGGDQVYPTPGWKEYNDRLVAPYSCSLPHVVENPPALFVIPGNHDWYDGLSNFLKLFCQKRWIGAWQTTQTRSYFAEKLPHNCWLWGIDIQLKADIDKAQIDYFDRMWGEANDGDSIILCTSEPAWVYQEYQPDDKPWRNLDFFKKLYSEKKDKKVNFRLVLTGDMHHYTSFKNKNSKGDWKITAGGGGAFTHPTHQVPDTLHLGDDKYQKSAAFPDAKSCRRKAWKNLLFPFINRRLGVFFAALYLLVFWITAANSGNWFSQETTFLHVLAEYSPAQPMALLSLFGNMLLAKPIVTLLLLIIFAGIYAFADKNRKHVVLPVTFGILHGILQALLVLVAMWLTSMWVLHSWSLELLSAPGIVLSILLIMGMGWLFSGFLMGIYLLSSTLLLKTHETEAFSSLKGVDDKNFIRFKIDPDKITVYALKIPNACRKWTYKPDAKGEEPRYEPAYELKYELIEDPIAIKK